MKVSTKDKIAEGIVVFVTFGFVIPLLLRLIGVINTDTFGLAAFVTWAIGLVTFFAVVIGLPTEEG